MEQGQTAGPRTPLTAEQVRTIKALLAAENAVRDLALFSVAVDTMLRSVDLLALTVGDCTDHEGRVLGEFLVRQQKTSKAVRVALGPNTAAVLERWIRQSGKHRFDYLFTGLRKSKDQPINASAYRQLVKQ